VASPEKLLERPEEYLDDPGAGSKIATDSESEPKDARLTPSRLRTLSRPQARWRSRRLSIAGLNSDIRIRAQY
jgi:hypothetical protein